MSTESHVLPLNQPLYATTRQIGIIATIAGVVGLALAWREKRPTKPATAAMP